MFKRTEGGSAGHRLRALTAWSVERGLVDACARIFARARLFHTTDCCFVVLLQGPEVKDLRLMHRAIVQNRRSAPPRRDCCMAGFGARYGALA